jgi:hypothetical protein
MEAVTQAAAERVENPFEGYADEPRPFGSYAAFTAVFGAAFGGALVAAKRSGRDLPERIEPGDLILIGVASHKVTRVVSKSKITSFVRAPFTELQGPAGRGEVEEKPRGRGLRRSLGELFTCPYCLGQWVTAGFAVSLVYAPRATRLVAGTYAATAIADFLQLAYKAAEQR